MNAGNSPKVDWLNDEWREIVNQVEAEIQDVRTEIERIAEWNQHKVLTTFQRHQVSDYHLAPSTGYAYNDRGREILDLIFADVFGAEAAIVRPHFVSGTHAISTALFGVLRPGDEMLFIAGKPYDTLQKFIGYPSDDEVSTPSGSLADWGIKTKIVDLLDDFQLDWREIENSIHEKTKLVSIQRSRGYEWRPSHTIEDIKCMIRQLRVIKPDLIVFVDNCYGEFTEELEPIEVGADLIAGSLIKNPGGGLALTGGYIAGSAKLVKKAAERLTAPGIGAEVGAMLSSTRSILQGLFMAPHVVSQAMIGAVFAANLLERFEFVTSPRWHEKRTDIIQALKFANVDSLLKFVQTIQKSSPIDSHVCPEPWEMPGYEHSVVMAAGTFVQGATLELSADAPIREPFVVYMQGGLTYEHVKIAIINALKIIFGKDDN